MSTIPIVSYQSGSATLGGSVLDLDVAIAAVDLSHSIILWSASGGNNAIGSSSIVAKINTPTEISFLKATSGPVDFTIEWQVIEFDASVNVQHLVQVQASVGELQTITSVDLTRSIVISNGIRNGGSTYGSDDEVKVSFANSTQVNFEAAGIGSATTYATVIEFPADAIASIQYLSGASSDISHNIAITSVDINKTLLFGSSTVAANSVMNKVYSMGLTNSTTVNLSKYNSAITVGYGIFVVEFTDYDVIHGSIESTSLTEVGAALVAPAAGSVVLGSVSVRPYLQSADDAFDDVSMGSWRAKLTGSTWDFTRLSNAQPSKLRYQLIDWGQLLPTKPTGNLELNTSNAIVRAGAPTFLWVPTEADENFKDLITGDIGVSTGATLLHTSDADGWATRVDGGTNAKLDWDSIDTGITSSEFTILTLWKWPGTDGAWQTAISLPGNRNIGMYVPRNQNDSYLASDSSNSGTTNYDALPVVSGELALFGVSNSTDLTPGSGWKDGVEQATSPTNMSYVGTGIGVRAFWGQGGEYAKGSVYGMAIFRRVLSQAEQEALAFDFYQLVREVTPPPLRTLPLPKEYSADFSSPRVKPREGVEIDTRNKLGGSVVRSFYPQSQAVDLLKGPLTQPTSGVSTAKGVTAFTGGLGQYLNYDQPLPLLSEMTILFSVRRSSIEETGGVISDKRVANWEATNGVSVNLRFTTDRVLFTVGSAQTIPVLGWGMLDNTTEFFNIACTWKAGTFQRIYGNGVEATYATAEVSGALTQSVEDLVLGSYYDLAAAFTLAGDLKYVHVLDRALSTEEIKDFNSNPNQLLKPRSQPLFLVSAPVVPPTPLPFIYLPKEYSEDFSGVRKKPAGDAEIDRDLSPALSFYFKDSQQNLVNNRHPTNVGSLMRAGNVAFPSAGDHFQNNSSLQVAGRGWVACRYRSIGTGRQNLIGFGTDTGGNVFRLSINYKAGVGGSSPGFISCSPNYASSVRGYVDLGAVINDGEYHSLLFGWNGHLAYLWFDGVEQALTFTSQLTHVSTLYDVGAIGTEVINGGTNYTATDTLLEYSCGNVDTAAPFGEIAENLYREPYGFLRPKSQPVYYLLKGGVTTVIASGTLVPANTEVQIVVGGRTLILTLTGDTLIA